MMFFFFFFQAEDGIRDVAVTGVQTCALPISEVVSDARTRNAWRRWGYRLLPGELFSYVLHMRPAEWPIMAGHTILWAGLAVGIKGARGGERFLLALGGLLILVILLNVRTSAINLVLCKERGE